MITFEELALLDEKFKATHPRFQKQLIALSSKYDKDVLQIYVWWKEYSELCMDQSALLFEFENWFKHKLEGCE